MFRFVQSTRYRNDVFGLTLNMFSNHLEMIVERGFPLLPKINHVISQMRDSGLMAKLNDDFIFNFTIISFMRELIEGHNEDVYMNGIFIFYFLGTKLSNHKILIVYYRR